MRQRPTEPRTSAATLAAWLVLMIAQAQGQTPPPPPSTVPPPPPRPEAPATPKAKPPAAPATKGKTKSRDEEPVVMSAEAMARVRGKGIDKGYGAEPDWGSLPSWRQTSFFGIRAEGQLFLYVVDCSGSMDDDARLEKAKTELRKTINALQSPQKFKVIFYNDRPVPMPGELPKPADYPSKAQLSRWLSLVQPGGATDPRGSLSMALALKPDAVFLLSDGAFPEGTVEEVTKLNPGKIPIHCIDLANGAAGDDLKKIARDSGGQYTARGR